MVCGDQILRQGVWSGGPVVDKIIHNVDLYICAYFSSNGCVCALRGIVGLGKIHDLDLMPE